MKRNIRNIGIFAHVDSGKTTLTERILFEAGEIYSPGSVTEGTTESDRMREEIERGISIAATTFQVRYKFKNKKYFINLIDTPGHLDFFAQVQNSLLAVDIAILLLDITTGIRSQTEMLLDEITKQNIPLIVFVNKIDKAEDLHVFLEGLKEDISRKLHPVFRIQSDFKNQLEYILHKKEIYEEIELPFIEWDDTLIDKYFKKPSKKILLDGLNAGFQLGKLTPLFAGSALHGTSVKELLDFICLQDFHRVHFTSPDTKGVLFRRHLHPDLGKLYYIKPYQPVRSGDIFYSLDRKFKVETMYEITPNEILKLDIVDDYSIFATTIPEHSFLDTGSLTKKEQKKAEKYLAHNNEYVLLIEPINSEAKDSLRSGLEKLTWEDFGLSFREKIDTGQFELRGAGELHLDVAINRLKEFISEIFTFGNLRVARYEKFKNMAITVIFEHSAFNQKLKSGTLISSLEKSPDFSSSVLWECELEEDYKSSVESAFYEILSNGSRGNPVLGVNLRVLSYERPELINDFTSNLLKVAIISGIKSCLPECTIEIGPLCLFEVVIPESFYGSVLAVLGRRNAKIVKTDIVHGNKSLLICEAAAENMLGFTSALRNMTKGKGFLSQKTVFTSLSHFEF
ncbi:MAG: GTP-binding protein [Leptospiraceae bacterium]|nr:GTP-binding protein [Leptospiraceae bacterium]